MACLVAVRLCRVHYGREFTATSPSLIEGDIESYRTPFPYLDLFCPVQQVWDDTARLGEVEDDSIQGMLKPFWRYRYLDEITDV